MSTQRKQNGAPVRLVKAVIDRVDGVDGPANEIPFLVMKAAVMPGDEDDTSEADGTAGDGVEVDVEAAPADDTAAADEEPAATVEPGETPGDSSWEKQDSANATKAAAVVATLKTQVGDLIAREQAEDENADVYDLADVQCALGWILGVLASFSFTEGADSDTAATDEKTGDAEPDAATDGEAGSATDEEATVTKSVTTDDVSAIVAAALNERLAPITKAVEALAAKPAAPAETKTTTEEAATAAEPVVKQSDSMTEVLKSTLPAALMPITKALGDIASVVASVSERLAAVEAQDALAGPLLKGAGPQESHLWGQGPSGNPYAALPGGLETADALTKAIEGIADPRARDEIGQKLAFAGHPLFSNKTQ